MAGEDHEVGAGRGHVDRQVRDRLARVEHDQRADLVGARGDRLERVDGAQDVGLVGERDDLGPLVEQLAEVGQVEAALVGDTEPAQRGAGAAAELLPRHQVGVVLHLGDDDLVAGAERGSARPQAPAVAALLIA